MKYNQFIFYNLTCLRTLFIATEVQLQSKQKKRLLRQGVYTGIISSAEDSIRE